MAEKLDPNEIITLEELAISSMWEITLSRENSFSNCPAYLNDSCE